MNLHYSQTLRTVFLNNIKFYYLMNLHYSQTNSPSNSNRQAFYYLMNLHYSQTVSQMKIWAMRILLPYEFTLFSNGRIRRADTKLILLPYEFTLFSNWQTLLQQQWRILLPYEFTLFSNLKLRVCLLNKLRPLYSTGKFTRQFYYKYVHFNRQ